MTQPVVLIAGPTASGKSALALRLAQQLGGEIVNADSMQVYADLNLLTARPSAEEEATIPHHLFGVRDAAEPWSAAGWAEVAAACIGEIGNRGRIAIVVGGTGFYFRALTQGLSEMPEIPPQIREDVRLLARQSPDAAYHALEDEDAAMAQRLNPGDRQRVARALEVVRATGQSLLHFRGMSAPPALPDTMSWSGYRLLPDREKLYRRIETRFDAMLDHGALDEVRALQARSLPADLPALKALGVGPLMQYLAGELSVDQARHLAHQESRRYAKRQFTWFRNQCANWPDAPDVDLLLARIMQDFC